MPPLADHLRLSRRQFLRVAALGAATSIGLLNGCTPFRGNVTRSQTTAAAMASAEPALTLAALGDIGTFDPFNVSDLTAPIVRNLYNTLIRLDPSRRATPELLERWSVADDGRTLVLRMRDGIKFHNGRNANADDLKANLDRATDPQEGSHVHAFTANVKSVEKKDHSTVAVHFYEPSPLMLDMMDLLALGDPSEASQYDEHDGGTGGFVLAERAPSDHVTLKRFDQYWVPERPRLDRIIVKFFNEEEAIVAALEDGSVDFAPSLTGTIAAGIQPGRLSVERIPIPHGLHALVLNPSRSPFDRREARQAIKWAIDRRALVDQTLNGAAEPALSFFPHGSPAYDVASTETGQFDLERARTLLGGKPTNADKITLLVGQHQPEWGPIANALKGWLEELGLSVEIWSAPVGQWFVALNNGQFHTALTSLEYTLRYPSAITWNLPLRTLGNQLWPKGVPPAYADAVKAASTTLDEGRQRQAWRAMQQALADEAWVIPLAWHYRYTVFRRRLDGIAWTLAEQLLLQDATLGS